MNDLKYLGWPNRETWQANVVLNNDHDIYQIFNEYLETDDSDATVGRKLFDWASEMLMDNGSFGDIKDLNDLHQVNWTELVRDNRAWHESD